MKQADIKKEIKHQPDTPLKSLMEQKSIYYILNIIRGEAFEKSSTFKRAIKL